MFVLKIFFCLFVCFHNFIELKFSFTCDMWRPMDRWTEQHSAHKRIPRFTEAHDGDPDPQSPQTDIGCRAGDEVKEDDFDFPDNIFTSF